MRMLFRLIFPVITATALVSSAGAAVSQSHNAVFVLKMSGDRGWEVECELNRFDDEPLSIRKNGRGDIETVATRGVSSGSCDYRVPEDKGELKIIFTNDGNPDQCPFEREYDQCVGRFPAGSEGSFEF